MPKIDQLTDDELEAELQRREVEYRNFVDEQQRLVNMKARTIANIKTELFKRKVAAQQNKAKSV